MSGTAVKAVVAYISDYMTKTTLKTYTMFDSIKGVYERRIILLHTLGAAIFPRTPPKCSN
jgi:ABC-type dipeptide/oligopeptide/nickel transport system permease component